MADASAKPDLKATRDRLRTLDLYFLEVLARAQAVSSTSAVLSIQSIYDASKCITQSMMDLEAYLQ